MSELDEARRRLLAVLAARVLSEPPVNRDAPTVPAVPRQMRQR